MRKLVILTLIICLALGLTACAAGLNSEDESIILEAVSDLASGDLNVKREALAVLNSYGEAAVPLLVKQMQRNQSESSFIGYDLVVFAEQLGEGGLPIIVQGLRDVNLTTRTRAAKAAYTLGPQAEEIVNEIAKVVLDRREDAGVRSQAVDALRAIKAVNPEVIRALAVSMAAEPMVAWKANQAITTLKVSFDEIIPVLFDELANKRNIYGVVSGISANLYKASDPVGLLREAFASPSEALQNNLWTIIDGLYPRMASYTPEISGLLKELAANHTGTLKEQAIYALGELTNYDETLVSDILAMINNPRAAAEDVVLLALALEKTKPDQSEVIEFFINALLDEETDSQVKLAAARYLEHCEAVLEEDALYLLSAVESFEEDVLWRLSPIVYQAAKQSEAAVDTLYQITDHESQLLQDFAVSVLSALGKEVKAERGLVMADDNAEQTPAFPTAEGYGRYTVGGRGGDVYIVTNLKDSGPGSLREAVNASGPRTVVFAVSGNIMLTSPLDIINPYITIAGQTAPGDGITVAGAPVNINTNQVIIRYLRFRMGDYNRYEADAIGGRGVSNVILDHISASWSTDECVSFYLTNNLTVQWSIISESLRGSVHVKGNHGYGGIWGGFSSFHHNLMAHHSSRTPRFDGERNTNQPATDMRNNVIYNWGFNSTYGGEGGNHNMIANYYKPGPGTNRGSVNHRIVEISNGGKWYIADNYVDGYPAITADNWAGGVQPRVNRAEDVKHDEEFPVPHVTTHSAEEAFELVLKHAGASLPGRDAIDKRIIEEVRTGTAAYGGQTTGLGTGIIDSQDDVGGLVFLRSFRMPLDSDMDGIPNWWAIKYGFDPNGGIDQAADLDGDGYTNIEEYLNGTNPLISDL